MVQPGLRIGEAGELTFVVESAHAIDFADQAMPAVLSTPWLIWFLEHAARNVVVPYLDAGESTVGGWIEVEHLAATPLGQTVTCRAHVVQREGMAVWFKLEAWDEQECIARAQHRLHIIQVERFARRVNQKRA